MAVKTRDRSQEILALQPRLLNWARVHTRDSQEAEMLTQETLVIAKDTASSPPASVGTEAWMFSLLRQRFYSIERTRTHQRMRSAFNSERAFAKKRALLAEVAAEPSDG